MERPKKANTHVSVMKERKKYIEKKRERERERERERKRERERERERQKHSNAGFRIQGV